MPVDRIIGQCNAADFTAIEHLVDTIKEPGDLDVSTLKHKERLALLFTDKVRKKGIGWRLLCEAVREVLFWGDGTNVHAIEVRFTRDPKRQNKVAEFRKLWPH